MCKYDISEQLEIIGRGYKGIKSGEGKRAGKQGVKDVLMSGIAMFSLKYPSLLQFDQSKDEKILSHNLRTLYGIEKVPSDTYMREVLDKVDPKELRLGFKALIGLLQRGKRLKAFRYIEEHYLLSVDGTGHFSSSSVRCENCCSRNHRNGSTTYHHNLLAGALVHPKIKAVIPVGLEPILKQDGETKNDCEMNAAKRFFTDFRREHPHLKTIVLQDALFGKAPHIKRLKALKLSYIIGVKSADHTYLFNQVDTSENTESVKNIDTDGCIHHYQFLNEVSLNRSNPEVKVNFLSYTYFNKKGEKRYFSWITDQVIQSKNLPLLMKAARARWKIENETFNTLKNQGYQFEHNFGHGHKNLSSVFSFLMITAFLMDQIQFIGSDLFKKALKKTTSKVALWFKLRSLFTHFFVLAWEDIFLSITNGPKGVVLAPNTS